MNIRITTACLASALMLTGLSAIAQTTATENSSMDSHSMTCQQMMDKAKPMVDQMSDQKKMAKAQKEMTEAQTNMTAGNTAGCKKHTEKAMKMAQAQ
jgi:hypothetical protein